jgi:hypothetical protein
MPFRPDKFASFDELGNPPSIAPYTRFQFVEYRHKRWNILTNSTPYSGATRDAKSGSVPRSLRAGRLHEVPVGQDADEATFLHHGQPADLALFHPGIVSLTQLRL